MLEEAGMAATNRFYIERQNETESNARSYPRKFPFCLKTAKGSWLTDVEGNKYLDFLCGAGTLALGHNDPEVNSAFIEMINSDAPLHTLDLTTPVKDEFVHTLFNLLPGELKNNAKIQFCSPAGTDATDAAIKLCKTATGRSGVIAFGGAFHGMGHGALSCTGNLGDKEKVHALMPEVYHFPYPYAYRDPFGLPSEEGTKACCNYFERTLKDPESGMPKPACVILEAIQGEGGVIPAPKEFLQTIRRVTKELDIPLIIDEIQAGVGRSGNFFAFEDSGIVPDVILCSKAIGGSLPLAVVVYNKKLDKWEPAAHTGTFRGNQLAMKGGIIVMNRVSKPEFLKDVREKGQIILDRMNELKNKVSIIGDVRGRGLMIGCEFIDPSTPADMLGSHTGGGPIAAEVQKRCFENKLVMEKGGRNGAVMRCLCALTVTREEIDTMWKIYEKVVLDVDKEVKEGKFGK